MSLGARLRQYIKLNGLTVRKFGEITGIPYRSLHEYLSDKRKPGADHLTNMIASGIDIEWLLTGSQKSAIVFDFSAIDEIGEPVFGIVLADKELQKVVLSEAISIVDEKYRSDREFAERSGFVGSLISVWAIFSMYCKAIDGNAEAVMGARERGMSAQDIVSLTLQGARTRVMELLKPRG